MTKENRQHRWHVTAFASVSLPPKHSIVSHWDRHRAHGTHEHVGVILTCLVQGAAGRPEHLERTEPVRDEVRERVVASLHRTPDRNKKGRLNYK